MPKRTCMPLHRAHSFTRSSFGCYLFSFPIPFKFHRHIPQHPSKVPRPSIFQTQSCMTVQSPFCPFQDFLKTFLSTSLSPSRCYRLLTDCIIQCMRCSLVSDVESRASMHAHRSKDDCSSSCIDALRRQCLVVVPFLNSYSLFFFFPLRTSSTKSHSFNTQLLWPLPRSSPLPDHFQILQGWSLLSNLDPLGFRFPKSPVRDRPGAMLSIWVPFL